MVIFVVQKDHCRNILRVGKEKKGGGIETRGRKTSEIIVILKRDDGDLN